MKEVIKNDIKALSMMFGGFIVFIIFAIVIPDDSIVKQIFAYFIVTILFLLIIFLTPLGNPIKKLYRRFFKKDEKI